MIKNEIKTKSF